MVFEGNNKTNNNANNNNANNNNANNNKTNNANNNTLTGLPSCGGGGIDLEHIIEELVFEGDLF